MRNSKKQRWIKFVRLEATTTGSRSFAAQHPLRDICAAAIAAAKRGEHFGKHPKQGSKNHVRLVDIQFDEREQYVVMLFREVDREGLDACYEDFETGDIEAHSKRPTQGNRLTLHLVVRLAGTASANGMQHRGVMEVVTGLASSVIQQRLTGALRPFSSGSGKVLDDDIAFTTKFEIQPQVDVTILEELKAGVLDHFVLVKPTAPKSPGTDEQPLVQEQRSTLAVKVVAKDRGNVLARIWDAVRGLANRGGYSQATAYYHTDEGRSASTAINVQKADALTDLVQRVMRIDLPEDVNSDLKRVSWAIAGGMIAELEKLEAKPKAK